MLSMFYSYQILDDCFDDLIAPCPDIPVNSANTTENTDFIDNEEVEVEADAAPALVFLVLISIDIPWINPIRTKGRYSTVVIPTAILKNGTSAVSVLISFA